MASEENSGRRFVVEIMNGSRDPRRLAVVEALRRVFPQSHVQQDPARNGPMWTYLQCLDHGIRALGGYGSLGNGDWVIILQDDAYPEPEAAWHLPRVLNHSPSGLLGLTHLGHSYRWPRGDEDYLAGPTALNSGGWGVRGDLIHAGLLEWSRVLWDSERFPDDDTTLMAFAHWAGQMPSCVVWPLFTLNLISTLKGHRQVSKGYRYRLADRPSRAYSELAVVSEGLRKPWAPFLRPLLRAHWAELTGITPTSLAPTEGWWPEDR